MRTKIIQLFRLPTIPKFRVVHWQMVATAAILMAAFLLAIRANDTIIWEMTKAITVFCLLNFLSLLSKTTENQNDYEHD